MKDFIKLTEPLLYPVQGSYHFLICTELMFNPMKLEFIVRGKLYSYENEVLKELGLAEVQIGGEEIEVARINENGNYID